VSGLRERLAAKARRQLVVPILVSDASTDQHTFNGAMVALQLAQAREDPQPGEVENLTKAVQDAAEAVKAHYVDVHMQALTAADWEAAMAKWTGDTVDWAAALPPLLAESCVDEELQDEQWWRERLGDESWTEGDIDALRRALLLLNVSAADPSVPKG
jgi:hypothetical protein